MHMHESDLHDGLSDSCETYKQWDRSISKINHESDLYECLVCISKNEISLIAFFENSQLKVNISLEDLVLCQLFDKLI